MSYKKLENTLLYILLLLTTIIYLYTVAPTLSFWDCGEFIASAYTLAVPHPPGTPFYILLGRVWLMIVGVISAILPISKEIAWHMNLLGLGFSVLTIFLIYKMILKIFRMFQNGNNELNNIIIAFATCLGIAFYYTYWRNVIETEVYAVATFVFVLINYITLIWYESVKKGTPKNKYLLLSFYLIFLSTGIHLTPFLIFVPLYIFIFFVERRYLKDAFFILLGVFQILFFALIFLLPKPLYTPVLVILGFVLLTAVILPLTSPEKYKNWRFFWAGIFLIVIGISTELYLPIRAEKLIELYKDKNTVEKYLAGENIAPRINECNPGKNFNLGALFDYNSSFNNVLHRAQYGPARLIPRKTQDETGFGLVTGYYWQLDLFVRYLSWQPLPEGVNRYFRAVVLALFYIFGIWGMVELYKREKKLFLLMLMIMIMLSFATIGYLNLRFSVSDSNSNHQPREVRERDYFFHTGHVYFGILIGLGFLGFTNFLKKETKNKNLVNICSLSGIVVFSLTPLFANIRLNNRYGDFIPKDYGYNMLTSCDDGAIIFTNGDNDTFPLWFAQEVLGTKRSVIVANLSLINTNWYIKQLKYWGTPISLSDYVIDRLEPIMTRDRKVVYVKDIMVRNIIATNAGIKLKNEDYFISQEEFATRYLKGYKGKLAIYFASTVSPDNFKGFAPYLRLEGLVNRVTGDSADVLYNVNVEKTKNFFFETYRYTGVFEPEKQKILSGILVDFEKRKKEGEFYDFAIQKDENTRRLYSNYAAGLHSLGIVLKEQGDIQGTIDAWRFAVLFETQALYFFNYNLGLLYATMGLIDSAEYYFSKIDLKDEKIMMQIGAVYRTVGALDRAIEYFRRAISINPNNTHPYIGLYTIYLEKKDTASAVQVLNEAISINPRDPQIYMGLYSLYIESRDTTSAIRVLSDWLKLNPRDTSAINMLRKLTKE